MLDGEEREEKGQNEVDFSFLKGDHLENNLEDNLDNNLDNNLEDNLDNNLDNNLEDNLENNLEDNLEDNPDNNTLEAAAVKESDSYSLQVYMSDGQVCFPFLSEIWQNFD